MSGFPFQGGPPGGLPFFIMPQPHQQPPQQPIREHVPSRVFAALTCMEHLTKKAEFDIAIWESGSTCYDGMKLTDEELNLQAKACNLLISYIDGTFKLTEEEKKHRAKQQAQATGPGQILHCLGCARTGVDPENRNQPCPLCRGKRYILVTPVDEP
jgi:hypothetical protein